MVADFLRDPQAHPLPDPPIQGLMNMGDPNENEQTSDFEFDDDEIDAQGDFTGSASQQLSEGDSSNG